MRVKKAGNARAAGAQTLGQGALRIEFQLEFAGQILAFELLVFAHVRGNHLFDLACGQQLAQAEAIDARVVGNRGQAFDAAVAQSRDQGFGNAAQPEAADRQGLVVGNDALQCRLGAGEELASGAATRRCGYDGFSHDQIR